MNTVIADNPHLTTRIPNGGKHPIRVVLDTHLRTPPSSHVITDGLAPTWIIVGKDVRKRRYLLMNLKYSYIPNGNETYRNRGPSFLERNKFFLYSLKVANRFMQVSKTNNFNEIVTYISPKLIGGKDAPTLFGGNGFSKLQNALSLKIQEMKQIGDDIKSLRMPETR